MKINADERNYTTLDEIENDIILTIAGWSESERTISLNKTCLNAIINDYFDSYGYGLTQNEYERITENVIEFFAE